MWKTNKVTSNVRSGLLFTTTTTVVSTVLLQQSMSRKWTWKNPLSASIHPSFSHSCPPAYINHQPHLHSCSLFSIFTFVSSLIISDFPTTSLAIFPSPTFLDLVSTLPYIHHLGHMLYSETSSQPSLSLFLAPPCIRWSSYVAPLQRQTCCCPF